MWGSTRTTGFCFTPHSRGARAEARRKPSLKESFKGTSNVEDKRQGSFQDNPYLNQSQLYGFPLFKLFLRFLVHISGSIQTSKDSSVQLSCGTPPELMKLFPILHSFHTIKLIIPSYSSPSWKTCKTCHIAFFPPNPVLLLSPTFTLWLQDPN